MIYVEYFFKSFISLFIIMGPFSILPVYISLTSDIEADEKKKIVAKTGFMVLGICLFFIFFGGSLFKIFGFSLDSFRISGGLLLLMMSISMLHAKRSGIRQTKHEELEGQEKDDISIFPLSIPMITGPGAISSIMLQAGEAESSIKLGVLALSVAFSTLLICILLRSSTFLLKILGRTGINIITRLMGLILAAISVEYIVQGIRHAFSL